MILGWRESHLNHTCKIIKRAKGVCPCDMEKNMCDLVIFFINIDVMWLTRDDSQCTLVTCVMIVVYWKKLFASFDWYDYYTFRSFYWHISCSNLSRCNLNSAAFQFTVFSVCAVIIQLVVLTLEYPMCITVL